MTNKSKPPHWEISSRENINSSDLPANHALSIFRSKPARTYNLRDLSDVKELSGEEARKLVNELLIHQVELDTQNEELRQAQQEVEAVRKKYFDLFDLAPVGYCTVDEKGVLKEINLLMSRMLGAPRAGLLGKSLVRFVVAGDQSVFVRAFNKLYKSRQQQSMEIRISPQKEEHFWAHVTMNLCAKGAGNDCQLTVVDITARKNAENALKESRDHLEIMVQDRTEKLRREIQEHKELQQVLALSEQRAFAQRKAIARLALDPYVTSGDLENALETILEVSTRVTDVRRVSVWNFSDDQAWLNCVGQFSSVQNIPQFNMAIQTKNCSEYIEAIARENRIAVENALEDPRTRCFSEEYLEPMQVRSLLDAGIFIEGRMEGVVCFEHAGSVRRWHPDEEAFATTVAAIIAQLYSNYERKKAEKQIMEANQRLASAMEEARKMAARAEEAYLTKSKFLANMSHELRTPMNAVLGFTHVLLRDSLLSRKNVNYIKLIQDNGGHLLRLINDILEMSRIEAGKLVLNEDDFFLPEMLDDILKMFSHGAEGIELRLEKSPELPVQVRADYSKLRMILINIVGNAVKFTDKGHVKLKCRIMDQPHEENQTDKTLIIEVEDTGPGIDEHELSKIFDPFHQTEKGLSAGGTGLGLSISLEYIKIMGGNIHVESTPGQGSRFTIKVPVRPAWNLEYLLPDKHTLTHDSIPCPDRPSAFTPQFSETMRKSIIEVLSQGDIFRLLELIDDAALEDEAGAQLLRSKAENFDYAGIRQLLKQGE